MNSIQSVAFAFMVLGTVLMGALLIPLAWCIPMCVHYYHNYNDCSVGFKVCSLIFVSIVGGVLMLCDK